MAGASRNTENYVRYRGWKATIRSMASAIASSPAAKLIRTVRWPRRESKSVPGVSATPVALSKAAA